MIEKYLSKLGNMYQKRKRPSFKTDLRAQLLNKALELNEAPAKTGFAWPDWQNFFVKRAAPALAAVMVVVFAFQFLIPSGSLLPQLVNVAEAKDYYVLTPQLEDETGVASESTFVLSSKGDLDVKEVETVLSVTPLVELFFEQISDREVAVTPADELDPGEIYSFSLEAQNLSESPYPKEYSWAYEVSDGFRVTGTLPGIQEAGVPTNTGIEVYFTHNGVDESAFENAFSISPAINGTFSVEGKTGIFAPSGGLKEATIYTVTIDGSLGLSSEENTLGEAYSFEFETDTSTRASTTLNFTKNIYEFSPEEAARMQMYYYGDGAEDRVMAVSVYAYGSGDAFLKALQETREEAPLWSYYQREIYSTSTSGLTKVVDMPESTLIDDAGDWLQMEDSLPAGYYLVEVKKNDATASTFLQVSETAVYLNLNNEAPLVWVNSTVTGTAVEGAEVSIVDSKISGKTNDEGVATFDNLYEELNLERHVDASTFFEVSASGRSTYYEVPLHLDEVASNDLYWQFMQTERVTYLPTDTVHYWGFIQGRETPIEESAELYLIQGYFWQYGALDTLEDRTVIEKQTISLKDGEAFEGSLDLKNLNSDSYNILIIQNDQLMSSTNFYVEDYVKPAYDLSLSSEKTALFEGETAIATLHAAFFEGTPVPNTEFRATLPTGEEKTVTTDENGDAQLSWIAEGYECTQGENCYLARTEYLTVSPVQEEMGEISESLVFKTFISRSIMDEETDVYANDEVSFQAYKLNLAGADYDASAFESYRNYELIYGDPDDTGYAIVNITQVDYIATETGEHYDPVDKVVRKKYDYDRKETALDEVMLKPTAQGHFSYDPALSEEHDYDLRVDLYDADGNYYSVNGYVSNGNSHYYGYSNYLGLERVGAGDNWEDSYVHLGEAFTFELSSDEENESWEGSFLFMESQNGLQKYTVQGEPTYSMTFGKNHVPNVSVNAVHFDGKHYRQSGGQSLYLNTDDRRMDVSVSADQESYEPGEEVTLHVQASEAAQVNLYLVDEAYYSLFAESFRDPLELIYSPMSSGVNYTYISHQELSTEGDGGKGGCFVAGTQILMADGSSKNIEDIVTGDKVLTRSSEWDATLTEVTVMNTIEHDVGEYLLVNGTLGVTEEHVLFINGKWQLAGDLMVGDTLVNKDGEIVLVESIAQVRNNVKVYNFETERKHTYFANGIYVHNDKGESREDFRDTALFTVVSTDANGTADVTFTLPDNITSWRISAAAVSGGAEIHAGYSTANIDVSKPLFVNPVINSTYLTGDVPSLPVRAYGDSLEAGAAVTFSMKVDEMDLGEKAGEAFETTYFELGALESGLHKISSTVEAGIYEDTVILPVNVVASHLSESAVSETLLSDGISLEGSPTERTEVHFLNNEVGIVYSTLMEAYYSDGDRADEALARTLAGEWLNETFDEEVNVPDYGAGVYQESEDGIALLPYADTDLELSAKMAALSPEHLNKAALSAYFEGILNEADRTLNEKILALYGLAGLGESYLTELNYFVEHFELEKEDKLFAALAYTEYGQDDSATELFLDIYAEGDAAWNALMATVAESIGSDLSTELWTAALDAEQADELIVLEKMLYAKARLEGGAQKTVSFKLDGEKIELVGSAVEVRSFLPEELDSLEISDVDGEVMAVTYYETPLDLEALNTSNKVTVERSYWVDGKEVSTLKTGDVVEVHLSVTSTGPDSFKVTDHLPSGLQTLTVVNASSYAAEETDQYRNPYNQDGQSVSFYVYCDGKCKYGKEFYYLARVINPGSFVLEPAVVQSYQDLDTINVSGERGTLTIE